MVDRRVDYLELQRDYGRGYVVQRQVLLAREDRFLLLADVVLGRRRAKLTYSGRLGLDRTISPRKARQTREAFLVGPAGGSRRPPSARALVLPLALAEWRATEGGGELAFRAHQLHLEQSGERRALYAGLFVDLDPRRLRNPLTWRQLSVAENRRNVAGDVAVGYWVRIGRQQWLLYRALARKGNRTLLGHNLSSEFLVGRFTSEGLVKKILEIE